MKQLSRARPIGLTSSCSCWPSASLTRGRFSSDLLPLSFSPFFEPAVAVETTTFTECCIPTKYTLLQREGKCLWRRISPGVMNRNLYLAPACVPGPGRAAPRRRARSRAGGGLLAAPDFTGIVQFAVAAVADRHEIKSQSSTGRGAPSVLRLAFGVSHPCAAAAYRLLRADGRISNRLMLGFRIHFGAQEQDDRRNPHPGHETDDGA
jgi:hypothetical protein